MFSSVSYILTSFIYFRKHVNASDDISGYFSSDDEFLASRNSSLKHIALFEVVNIELDRH